MPRNTVGARELKARLGKYLRTVRSGKTIIVTDRGEPIAELRPIPDDMERKLAKLRAAGLVSGRWRCLRPFEAIRAPAVSLSDAVIQDRDEMG